MPKRSNAAQIGFLECLIFFVPAIPPEKRVALVVPEVGFEPTHLAAGDFESPASTVPPLGPAQPSSSFGRAH